MKIYLFILLFIILVSSPQNSKCMESVEKWTNDLYSKITYNGFKNLPVSNKIIEFSNIDYPLLGASIFYATNEIRRKHRLKLFNFSALLYQAAFMHSEDMVNNNFMAHISPLPGKRHVRDRIRKFYTGRISWYGENIAGRYVDKISYLDMGSRFVDGWMNSPGHRANILRVKFSFIGAGVYFNKSTREFVGTQVFVGRFL